MSLSCFLVSGSHNLHDACMTSFKNLDHVFRFFTFDRWGNYTKKGKCCLNIVHRCFLSMLYVRIGIVKCAGAGVESRPAHSAVLNNTPHLRRHAAHPQRIVRIVRAGFKVIRDRQQVVAQLDRRHAGSLSRASGTVYRERNNNSVCLFLFHNPVSKSSGFPDVKKICAHFSKSGKGRTRHASR
ncbi:MAG: hypothetical protein JWO78_185 [Micavibrio sp.]|nr:hypothetical protein [Micavibrio sp.]